MVGYSCLKTVYAYEQIISLGALTEEKIVDVKGKQKPVIVSHTRTLYSAINCRVLSGV